jgi:hypothetical protein
MAKVKFASPISGLRGTVEGTTYSANKSGPFLKIWRGNPKLQSEPVTVHRTIWAAQAAAWRALSAAQRTGWDTYAAAAPQQLTDSLGQTYFASGFNWFVKINSQLLTAGRAARTTAPTSAPSAAPTILAFNVFANPATPSLITFAAASFLGGDNAPLFISIANSTARATPQPNIRLVVIPAVGSAVTQIVFTTEIRDSFGTIQTGQRCFCELFRQNSHGRRGASTTAQTNVV